MVSRSKTRRSMPPVRVAVPSPASTWRTTLMYGVLLAAGTLAVYSQAWTLSFINIDDPEYASLNPHVQAGLSSQSLQWSLGVHDCNWIPLTWLSLMLDSSIHGIGPAGYHITNVLLHTANALILFVTLAMATGSQGRSAFVAALFAIHPLHVESVAWVAERKDVLSIFFGLLSLRAYVGYAREGKAWRYVAACALFLCSLLSKPTLVTLPFVCVLLDYWPLGRLMNGTPARSEMATPSSTGRSILGTIVEKLPFLAVAAGFSTIAVFAQSRGGAMTAPFPLLIRFENAVCVYLAYLEKAAYPTNLSVFYPHPGQAILWTSFAIAAAVLLAVTVGAIKWVRRWPFLFVGWFWYLGTLVPMIGLVQIGTQQMADRYTYFPLIGVFIAAVWLLWEVIPVGFYRSRVLPFAGVAWLMLLSAITFSQLSYWHDSVTLLRHSQSCTPENSMLHEFLGAALMGDDNLDEAVIEYQAAIRLATPHAPLHTGLAYAYEMLGRKDDALGEYRIAASLDPQSVDALNGIARGLSERKEFADARHYLDRSRELNPDNPLTYADLASLSGKTGDFAGALSYAERGLQLNPRLYSCELESARALRGLKRFDEAIQRLQHLATVAPDDPLVQRELAQTLEQKRAASGK
ncbi:MAG TPA: tetratricopeptide repeat protein [Planctomycetaceae bacterium]|nr:tetratricopeptide repeat protein [Planctomycetaceae bacterium]